MWQITWMLGFLPSWFWTTVLFLSIIGLLLAWLFTKLPYSLPVKVFSILGIVLSVWALGAAANEEKWQARIKELADAAKYWGQAEGRAVFFPNTRKISDEQHSEQIDRMKQGLIPNLNDLGAVIAAKKTLEAYGDEG